MKDFKLYVKIILKILILFLLASIILYVLYGLYKENQIEEKSEIKISNTQTQNIVAKKVQTNIDFVTPADKEYMGYDVDARLEVPSINLYTNVLAKYTEEGLKVCVSKYYGPKANEIGNFCIAGHNYKKENMFFKLIDLKIGDKMYLVDLYGRKIEYEIYDIYKVKPENTAPLEQNTFGKREITLITCVNYSPNRLIIKARERGL